MESLQSITTVDILLWHLLTRQTDKGHFLLLFFFFRFHLASILGGFQGYQNAFPGSIDAKEVKTAFMIN